MSAAALTPNKLDVDTVRDGFASAYNPVGAFETMLVLQMAQTFVRLQNAYDVDRRYRAGRDMLEVITGKLAEFKAVQGYVRDCERAWNHAKENLEKEQRKRKRETQPATAARPVQNRPAPPPVTADPKLPPSPRPPSPPLPGASDTLIKSAPSNKRQWQLATFPLGSPASLPVFIDNFKKRKQATPSVRPPSPPLPGE